MAQDQFQLVKYIEPYFAYCIEETKSAVIINRKCASSSIITALKPIKTFRTNYIPKGYDTIACVRHPWDRLASFWTGPAPTHKSKKGTWGEFIDHIIEGLWQNIHALPQTNLPPLEHVVKFENLEYDWKALRFRLPKAKELTIVNKSSKEKSWKELMKELSDEQFEKLVMLYQNDFHRFHYPLEDLEKEYGTR